MSLPAFFTAQGLCVGYDGKPLIRDIRIEIRPGEILTLIGPNGAGKSTVLKSIARQLKVLSGSLWLGGEDVLSMKGSDLARRQAVMLTDRHLPEMMTCREVVAMGRYPYTGILGLLGAEDEKKIRKALRQVHCEELLERDFRAISDGQRQMVLLARAICQEPELIILDEPTSFLDIRHKMELLLTLRRMAREKGLAILLSLHELDLAEKISDQVMCIKGPYVESYGRPEEIFRGEHIASLYDLQEGSYDDVFGCLELPPPGGKAQTFVIGGGGSAAATYRHLVREGIPFVTGILSENDLDAHSALHLASEIITSPAYCPVEEATFLRARERMAQCERVYCPLQTFGPYNEANRLLREEARQRGLLALDFP